MDQRWPLWGRQILTILRLELRKNFWGLRAIPMYFLALAPVLLFGARAILPLPARQAGEMGFAANVYAGMFQLFFLRLAVFFGCVAVFSSLFRGDVMEKTLHYYLLAPLRREILVIGKYLSGLVATVAMFSAGAGLSFLLLYVPYGPSGQNFLWDGPGAGQLAAYLGVTVLACMGYGAVFLAMGLLFRNPIVPAAVILGWEGLNVFLPPALKKISVLHYLLSLCPVPFTPGPFAFLTEPTPAWIAVPGLLALTVVVMMLACRQIRRLEISYGAD